jgi:hypothetical protein
MRANLVAMLDGIGLHRALELPSGAALFADRHDLAATTSAICHAVFLDGRNYSGSPLVDRHPLLRAFARQTVGRPPPLRTKVQRSCARAGVSPMVGLRRLPPRNVDIRIGTFKAY